MESNTSPSRGAVLQHLGRLLKAGAGTVVVASTTLATTPAEAKTRPAADRPSLSERVSEIRKQFAAPDITAETSEPGPATAWWGNGWHNWRNGWHNWHNWHNWRNFG